MQVRGTFPELSAGRRAGSSSKMSKVMQEFMADTLRSGSKTGPKVTSRKQAVAIGLSEAGLTRVVKGKGKGKGKGTTSRAPMMAKQAQFFGAKGRPARSSAFGTRKAVPVINAPKTLAGRREAARGSARRAYGEV